MTQSNWAIDANSIEPTQISAKMNGVDQIDPIIAELYRKANVPYKIDTVIEYSRHLNVSETSKRVKWVYELLDMDYRLGPGGYGLRFNLTNKPYTYGFFQLLKYDPIYRPMKYVYMPFGMTSNPAIFSRDIAENACAHVHECVKNLFSNKGLPIHPRATLGTAIKKYPGEFDSDMYGMIDSINKDVYNRAKHEFNVRLPKLQLLSLADSLATYFICRKLGLRLLQQANTLVDVIAEIKRGETQRGIFIGQDWFI